MSNTEKSGYAGSMASLRTISFVDSSSRDTHFERKMSTTSFDLRRKTKHHRHRNGTTLLPTAKPVTMNDEEMEFSLRVRK